jgi:hypothetical protein
VLFVGEVHALPCRGVSPRGLFELDPKGLWFVALGPLSLCPLLGFGWAGVCGVVVLVRLVWFLFFGGFVRFALVGWGGCVGRWV